MKICLVCAQGGHYTQMLHLLKSFENHDYFFVTYKSEVLTNDIKTYFLIYIKGRMFSRLNIISGFFEAIRILMKEKPDVIISTGSGIIAIPFCYVGKVFGSKVIFIETLARVTTPSAGGKLIYPVADLFLVQWESLLSNYGKKAQYWGKII